MCGIAGYIRPKSPVDVLILEQMLKKIAHRGPDGQNTWTQPAAGLALAHARLKVQDLSQASDQPMHSADGAVTLIYNGEIYNFSALRAELASDGAVFKSSGDTEVLLELCRRNPDLTFLPRLNGMFAFALWHEPSQTLSLVRDRTGVKPLLYAALPDAGLAFASELAALRPILSDLSIDPHAVLQLLTLGFIAAPRSIFHRVHKLRPGHLLQYRGGRIVVEQWGSLPTNHSAILDFSEAGQHIRDTLTHATETRLVADVPVGIFLSGGIDSAIITAVASKVSSERVKTFSVGFPDQPYYDESRYAQAVADQYDTDHTVLPLTLDQVREVIPDVQNHIGEPFADSSALPTYLLSRLTRQHVTVALSGDGADELFAGYNRYAAATLIRRFGWFAHTPLYRPLRGLIESLPAKRETRLGGWCSMMKRAVRSMDRNLPHRYANWMRTSDNQTFSRLMHDPIQAGTALSEIVQVLWRYRGKPKKDADLNRHLRTEWQLSLPDDMLTKIDLMSMASGLEVRSPFLDQRVVDLVMPMNWHWKLKGWKKKHLLIETFKDELPPILHHRSKKGFEVPVGPWLRGPLNPMARDLIHSDTCFFGRLLSRRGALETLEEHTAGRADHTFCLWALISLLAWQQIHAPGIELAED